FPIEDNAGSGAGFCTVLCIGPRWEGTTLTEFTLKLDLRKLVAGLIAVARCHRDALASLGAPARKNRLSALGLHPRTKTVRFGPVAPIRLECALGHGNSLVLLTRISAAKQTLSINDAGVKGQTHPVTMTRPSWYTCSLT